MAGYSSLTRGLMDGYGFVDSAMRQRDEDAYRKEVRQRDRKRYEEEEAIRNARAAPIEGGPPGLPMAPVPGAMPAPADVGVAAVPEAGPIERRSLMATERLTNESPETERQMLANTPAVGLTPVGGPRPAGLGDDFAPGRAPVVQGDKQIALPAEPAGAPQMQTLPYRPGSEAPQMQNLPGRVGEQPQMQQLSGAAPALQPGAAPARAPMAPQQFASMRAMNADFEAKKQEALKRGRPDMALQYHVQGMKLRDQLRSEVGDAYRKKYEMSGDPNALLPFFNEFVGEGTTIDSVRRVDGPKGPTFEMAGSDDGKAFKRSLSAAEMTTFIRTVTDPAGQRALEAKQAEEYYKAQLKIAENQSDPSKRFHNTPPGGTTTDVVSGRQFTAPKDPSGIKYHYEKGDDGTRVFADGRYMYTQPDGTDNMPKEVRDLEKSVVGNVFQYHKVSDMAGLDPATQKKVSEHMSFASRLIGANYDQPWFKEMGQGEIVSIAAGLQDGSIKPNVREINGQTIATDFTFGGRRYALVPKSRLEGAARGQAQGQTAGSTPGLPKQGDGRGGQAVSGKVGRPAPKAGDVLDGYRFKGGDPRNQASWEPA